MTDQNKIIEKISPLIYVTDSNGKIETSQVIKENNRFKNIKNYLEYNLKRPKNSILESMIEDIQKLDNQVFEFKWYNLTFLQKIFFNKKKKLIKEINSMKENCSWIIMPNSIFEIVNKKITQDDILILKSSQKSNNIFFGNYDSFELILNSSEEYQIIQKNKIKILELI